MRIELLGFATFLALPLLACAAETSNDDDDSDAAWSALSTEDSGPAVLEDPETEPLAAGDGEVDDTDDPGEPSDLDVDDAPEPTTALAVTAAKRPTYKNAVYDNCADPGVIRLGPGNFLAACTGGGFPMLHSTNLVSWAPAGHLFTLAKRPKWASKDFWAPELHHIGTSTLAYFAAFSPKHDRICIGVATQQPNGSFEDFGRPLLCDRHVGLIDPHVFTDGDRHYLYYKTDSNGLSPKEPTVIYAHELGADGKSFKGKRHHLIQNRLPWEGDVVEAPWVARHGGYFYLFYSGFRYCNATYGVGVARSRSPLGPFHKRSGPILRSNATWVGPGHNSVVTAGGHDWIVYHAWHGAHACGDRGNRELLVDRIGWANGWPHVNDGTPSIGRRAAPGG